MKIAMGLGSNLGDRLENLKKAYQLLNEEKKVNPLISSSIYESPPWGVTEVQNNYLNQVWVAQTQLNAIELVFYFKELEKKMGRKDTKKYASRIIDFDLLVFGNEIIHLQNVIVPHAHMIHRDFVLLPLNELWSDWVHPIENKSVSELLNDLSKTQPLVSKVFAPALQDNKNL